MTTREQWLNAAVDLMRPWFEDHGKPLPERVMVSIGWNFRKPTKGLGECWADEVASDGLRHIFLSPRMLTGKTDIVGPQGILATLLHELCHAALPYKTAHRKPFQKLAAAMGLVGPWTATSASEDLMSGHFAWCADQLGEFPGGSLSPMVKGKAQKNRHIKCECTECGYIARVSRKHLDAMGAPHCPAHGEMEIE